MDENKKQLVGEPTAEWVSYECSSNKHGLWICQSTSSHGPLSRLPINTDEENMWSGAALLFGAHSVGSECGLKGMSHMGGAVD